MAKAMRVSGHTLVNEGAPYSDVRTRLRMGTGGRGRGLCTCGVMSDVLDSSNQRKQWHRDHKADVSARKP